MTLRHELRFCGHYFTPTVSPPRLAIPRWARGHAPVNHLLPKKPEIGFFYALAPTVDRPGYRHGFSYNRRRTLHHTVIAALEHP